MKPEDIIFPNYTLIELEEIKAMKWFSFKTFIKVKDKDEYHYFSTFVHESQVNDCIERLKKEQEQAVSVEQPTQNVITFERIKLIIDKLFKPQTT